MRKLWGWILFAAGAWMLISPQALLSLKELKWLYNCAFPGEALAGILALSAAYYLLDFSVNLERGNKDPANRTEL
jgi:hypothetical protein